MVDTTTASQSLWLTTAGTTDYPIITPDAWFDVVVVGGGITGLTTALLLKRAGCRVAVVEAGRVGTGVSGNNTAKVSALQATVYSAITKIHDTATAARYATAASAGVELVGDLVRDLGIDCGFEQRPAYTYAFTPEERDSVRAEAEAAANAGLPAEFVEDTDLPFTTHGAVRLDGQARLHPLRYVQGLAAAVDGDGSQVFENSRVLTVRERAPITVRTEHGDLRAPKVVIATHYPILDRGLYFARLEPKRSYCVAATLRSGSPPEGLAISAGDPAWSISSDGSRVIVGGQGHSVGERGDSAHRYDELIRFAREHWDVEAITHRWSAQDPVPYDHLPMIGPYTLGSQDLFVATGFLKWGLSTGSFAGSLLTDLVLGHDHPLAATFNPRRITLRSSPTVLRLGAEFAADFVGDRLSPASANGHDLTPGQARVRPGHTGEYRDENGVMHAVSLRCTHLGCLLRFNNAEHSWDCPCHGSRFAPDGAVLEGPATRPLRRKG